MIILSALVLAVVVSIDTLASGFAYGSSNIKVPLQHVFIIDAIGSVFLSAGLLFGFLVSHLIYSELTQVLSLCILIAIGCYKIITYLIKKIKKTAIPCEIKWTETIALAIALSFDNIAVGIGAAIHNASIVFCIAVIVLSQIVLCCNRSNNNAYKALIQISISFVVSVLDKFLNSSIFGFAQRYNSECL